MQTIYFKENAVPYSVLATAKKDNISFVTSRNGRGWLRYIGKIVRVKMTNSGPIVGSATYLVPILNWNG